MKKITRTLITMLVLICMTVSVVTPAFATGTAEDTKPELTVTVNRRPVVWREVEPFINSDNRTLVPLRVIANAMNLEVVWDNETRTASFTEVYPYPELCPAMYHVDDEYAASVTVSFQVDSNEYTVVTEGVDLGGTYTMDTAAVIVDSRIFTPIRFLAESFGYDVGWDGENNAIALKDYLYYTKSSKLANGNIIPYYTLYTSETERMAYIIAEWFTHDDIAYVEFKFPSAVGFQPIFKALNTILEYNVAERYWAMLEELQVYAQNGNPMRGYIYYENTTLEERIQYQNEVYNYAAELLNSLYDDGTLTYDMTEMERARILKDVIMDMTVYEDIDDISHSAWSLFYRGTGVCSAYASAYNLLLDMDGIKCRMQSAWNDKIDEGHSWTIAILDGAEYIIDVTWCDTTKTDKYFCMTEEVFNTDYRDYELYPYIWY